MRTSTAGALRAVRTPSESASRRLPLRCCPLIQHRGQVLVHALLGQVGLEHAHDHEVVLGGEVLDVLGHQHPVLPSRGRGDLPVRAGIHSEVADMHRVVTAFDEPRAGTWREHLVDEKPHDAMRRARCSAS